MRRTLIVLSSCDALHLGMFGPINTCSSVPCESDAAGGRLSLRTTCSREHEAHCAAPHDLPPTRSRSRIAIDVTCCPVEQLNGAVLRASRWFVAIDPYASQAQRKLGTDRVLALDEMLLVPAGI